MSMQGSYRHPTLITSCHVWQQSSRACGGISWSQIFPKSTRTGSTERRPQPVGPRALGFHRFTGQGSDDLISVQAAQAARDAAKAQLAALQITNDQRQSSVAKERSDLEVGTSVMTPHPACEGVTRVGCLQQHGAPVGVCLLDCGALSLTLPLWIQRHRLVWETPDILRQLRACSPEPSCAPSTGPC